MEQKNLLELLLYNNTTQSDNRNPSVKLEQELVQSIIDRDGELLNKLLKSDEIDTPISQGKYAGCTLAFIASITGASKIFELLIEKGANVKTEMKTGGFSGKTPIYVAAAKGYVEIVNLLISAEVDCEAFVSSQIEMLLQNLEDHDLPAKFKTPLFAAALNGHLDVLKVLFTKNSIKNVPLLLCAATYKNHKKVIEFLIEKGAKINDSVQEDPFKGITPIFIATSLGNLDLVKLMVNCGAAIHEPIREGIFEGMTPFLTALINCQHPKPSILSEGICKLTFSKENKLFISSSAVMDFSDELSFKEYSVPVVPMVGFFNKADSAKGHLDVIEFLVKKSQSTINVNSPIEEGEFSGMTPVYIAASLGILPMVVKLIELEADCVTPLQNGTYTSLTPLFAAVANNHVSVVEYLAKKKAEINKPIKSGEYKGMTPIFLPAALGHLPMIEKLIEFDTDYLAPIKDGSHLGLTPFFVAILNNHRHIAKFLIEKNAKVNTHINTPESSSHGTTPLYFAVSQGSRLLDVIKFLIEQGADVNEPIKLGPAKGLTPFYCSVHNCDVPMVRFLLSKGTDPNEILEHISLANGRSKHTYLTTALNGFHKENIDNNSVVKTLEILIYNGANVDTICSSIYGENNIQGFQAINRYIETEGMIYSEKLLQIKARVDATQQIIDAIYVMHQGLFGPNSKNDKKNNPCFSMLPEEILYKIGFFCGKPTINNEKEANEICERTVTKMIKVLNPEADQQNIQSILRSLFD